jgi:hypothetical protein
LPRGPDAEERSGQQMTVERFPVEAGHIMMFARAIADPNPVYADEEYAKGTEVGSVIAPPTFVVAGVQFEPEFVLRPEFAKPWFGSGLEATGIASGGESSTLQGRGLHAEQHFEYHRALRAGDVLTGTTSPGEEWEKEGRSGKLVFSEAITEYRDQHGEPVVTARSVVVVTEQPVTTEQA